MKKVIMVAITLLAIDSCGYQSINNQNSLIITETAYSLNKTGYCYYIGRGTDPSTFVELFASTQFCFYDSCGKFNVGDTVKIIKK